MPEYNTYIDQSRTGFGKYLKRLRTDRKMTQASLKEASGVAATLISAYEHGERVVGPEVAVKLADAMQLQDCERDRFLMGAASTRRRDRLVGEARDLPPELVNYVPRMLPKIGIKLDQIQEADIWNTGDANDRYIGNRLDHECMRVRTAMMGMDQHDLLYVVADGKRYLCAFVAVPMGLATI
jgi:transcriptional regulator with XRE-family HTH domain